MSSQNRSGQRGHRWDRIERLVIDAFRRQMRDVVFPPGRRMEAALIEEAPGAYKDIKEVLGQQRDLVRPVQRLEPIAVVKG